MSGWLGGLAARIGGRFRPDVELPSGTRLERDLAYGSDPAQRLDLYLPPEPTAGPLIVIVGGGAWSQGDKAAPATMAGKLAHWLPTGRSIASIGYRRLPEADPLEQARDVARALAFLQRRLAAEGHAPRDAFLVGHSSGAHLVALLAADMSSVAIDGVEPWLASVLIDSAALDVVGLMEGPHLPLHDRAFGSSEAGWRHASPLHRLRGQPAPMLLVHSSRRPLAGEQAREFAAAVVAMGGQAEVLSIDLSHADLNVGLGRDPEYTACIDAFLRTVVTGFDAAARPSGS
ncbi:MAG TPA: alpha/beta hydrolase [Caldimonas sp.]|jgi:acetyl esterase/lipase